MLFVSKTTVRLSVSPQPWSMLECRHGRLNGSSLTSDDPLKMEKILKRREEIPQLGLIISRIIVALVNSSNQTRRIARAFARLVLKIQKFACRFILT